MRDSCSFSVPIERNQRVLCLHEQKLYAVFAEMCPARVPLQGRGLARCGGVQKQREHARKQRQQDEPLPLEGSESLPCLLGPPGFEALLGQDEASAGLSDRWLSGATWQSLPPAWFSGNHTGQGYVLGQIPDSSATSGAGWG